MKTMTKEEMRIAIAEWMGWSLCTKCTRWHSPTTHEAADLPNFSEDLNAIHEAEKNLNGAQTVEYGVEVLKVIEQTESISFDDQPNWGKLIQATASQCSEALCRTLWPERFETMKGEA